MKYKYHTSILRRSHGNKATCFFPDGQITRGVWKSGNPESGIGTGIGTGTGTGTGIGTGMGRETYKKQGQHLP